MSNARKIPRQIISPVELAARDYWLENRNYQAQIQKFRLPPWDERPEDSKIICLSRVMAWATVDDKPCPIKEHSEWARLCRKAGWRKGEYDLKRRTHPMLVEFGECPIWFQAVTVLFCDTVTAWKPAIKEYLEPINGSLIPAPGPSE